jgi:alkylation response protein AidB-like acyl-CoA dehydrogenase
VADRAAEIVGACAVAFEEEIVKVTHVPTRAELVARAQELVPVLKANALSEEENRQLSDDTVGALTDAGIFRMRVPAHFGGYECDTRTLVEVSTHIARGSGAAAFAVATWWITSWVLGLFPDELQDDVFSTRDVRACGTLAATGTATPANGGVIVTGRWAFNTGATHSKWKILAATLSTPDGGVEPIMAVVPVDDIKLVDDWYTSALQGTGSVTAIADELYVPAERYLRIAPLLEQRYASRRNAGSPMYRAPMIAAISASTAGKLVGLAKAAREAFFERLPDRGITHTAYTSQAAAPVTHLQVAEASLKIDEAEFHAYRLATMVDEKGLRDEPWTLEERAYSRMVVGRTCQLAKDVADLLNLASGSSSLYSTVPIQRIQRDVQAINLHALNNPTTNLELYGRILCGLEPNTPFV